MSTATADPTPGTVDPDEAGRYWASRLNITPTSDPTWGPGICPFCGELAFSVIVSEQFTGTDCSSCPDGVASGFELLADKLDPPWPDEPDLPIPARPTPLPLDAFPAVLSDHVESVAASMGVSPDMPALLSLLTVSAAIGGKVEVRVDDAWRREWSVLYGIVILPSGERKSPTFDAMVRPISDWEADRREEVLPLYSMALDNVDVCERSLESLKRRAGNGKLEDPNAIQVARKELEAARKKVPVLPRILIGDATPEALQRRMGEHEGRAAMLSPEGDPLRIADGRYSEGSARLDELKKGWSGESLSPERIGRDTVHVRYPALTLGLCLQPSVLETLKNQRSMHGEGLFARILWARPRSLVGWRRNSGDARPRDESAAARYAQMLYRLLDMNPQYDANGEPVPAVIRLTSEAHLVICKYQDNLERELRPGGSLKEIADWGAKAHGQAVRIALMISMATRLPEDFLAPIDGEAMRSAVRIMEALTTHALEVYSTMRKPSDEAYVLRRALDLPYGSTLHDLQKKCGSRLIEDLERIVGALQERGCLRLVEAERSGKRGRPKSPTIEIHPKLREPRDRNGTNTDSSISGISVSPFRGQEVDPTDVLSEAVL